MAIAKTIKVRVLGIFGPVMQPGVAQVYNVNLQPVDSTVLQQNIPLILTNLSADDLTTLLALLPAGIPVGQDAIVNLTLSLDVVPAVASS